MVGLKIKAIDGSVKKLTLVKNPHDKTNYKYKLKERYVTRKEAIDALLKVLDGNELTREDIVQQTGLEEVHIHNIIQKMKDAGLIRVLDKKKDGRRLYTKHYECLLADLFFPSAEEIEKNFKIKSKTVRKVDQGTSKGSGTKQSVTYTNSYYDGWDL